MVKMRTITTDEDPLIGVETFQFDDNLHLSISSSAMKSQSANQLLLCLSNDRENGLTYAPGTQQ